MSQHGIRFRNAYFTDPEIISSLQNREMRNENLINKIRASLLLFFAIGDTITFTLTKTLAVNTYLEYAGIILIILTISYFIHRYSSDSRYRPGLKYITVTFDFLIIVSLILYFLNTLPPQYDLPLSKDELIILFAFAIFIYISSGILRSQPSIIIYNAALALLINVLIFAVFSHNYILLFYTSFFHILAAVFIYAMSGYIVKHEAANIRLQQANSEINKQKEEIESQRDEIEQQRDKVTNQNNLLSKKNEQIEQSIQYASRIQSAVLPDIEALKEFAGDYFIYFQPRDVVSGDFYWVKRIDHKIIFTVADCTGHGVPGAFMSLLGISFLNELSSHHRAEIASGNYVAADLLNDLRNMVKNTLHQDTTFKTAKDGMDMALLIVDTQSVTAHYAGAYNPLYLIRNGDIQTYKADRMPIGIHRKNTPFTNNHIRLQPNDRLYIFSDGYIDQFGGQKGHKFKSKHFKDVLLQIHQKSMKQQHEDLKQIMAEWRGNTYSQLDDMLVLGVKV